MRTFFHTYDHIAKVPTLSLILILFPAFFTFVVANAQTAVLASATSTESSQGLSDLCLQSMAQFRSYYTQSDLTAACKKAEQLPNCKSVDGVPLYHIDQKGKNAKAQNVLVFSLIHGDETGAGTLGRHWVERITKVDPRNNWRIIPILNPDGLKKKTRANIRGVDLNRNFPTADWEAQAHEYWRKGAQGSPRKFPGDKAASEPEVNCAISHIQQFKPDFVISIHTPLHVLDFDGPKMKTPAYEYLPWKRLGNFPGSLGRFLWVEQHIPVLTTELRADLPATAGPFEQLQDLIGLLVQTDLK